MKILQTGDYFFGIQNMGKKESSPYLFSQIHDYARYLSFVCQYAINNQIDAVLISGNLFFSSLPNDHLQSFLLDQIRDLAQSKIHVVILEGKYDQPCQGYSFLDLLRSLPYAYIHSIQKDDQILLKNDNDSLQIVAIPYKNHFSTEEIEDLSNSEAHKQRVSKLLPKIQSDVFSILFTQARLTFLEPFFLVPNLPSFDSEYLESLPFQYFALGGHPFKKCEKGSKNGTWITYPGSLGEFEYADSTIERGFLVFDTLHPSGAPEFIKNTQQRSTALIRVYANSEKEVFEKLNEEFLLNDYREHITRIVLHTDTNLSLSKIYLHFEDHCYHIHSIEQQGKRLCFVGDEEVLPIRNYIDAYFEEQRLPFPSELGKEITEHCLSYLYKNELIK